MKLSLTLVIISVLTFIALAGIHHQKSNKIKNKLRSSTLAEPTTYSKDGYMCQRCHNSCSECSEPFNENKCTKCKDTAITGKFLLADGTCIGCPDPTCSGHGTSNKKTASCDCAKGSESAKGKFYGRACGQLECAATCAACSGPNPDQCTKCFVNSGDNFLLKGSSCVGCPGGNVCANNGECIKPAGTCSCYQGYFGIACSKPQTKLVITSVSTALASDSWDNFSKTDQVGTVEVFVNKQSAGKIDLAEQVDQGKYATWYPKKTFTVTGWSSDDYISIDLKDKDPSYDDDIGSGSMPFSKFIKNTQGSYNFMLSNSNAAVGFVLKMED